MGGREDHSLFIVHMRHIMGCDRYHLGSIRSARTMKMKIDRLFC
jgi:hypothetical protein